MSVLEKMIDRAFYRSSWPPRTPRMPPSHFAEAGTALRAVGQRARIYIWTVWRALRGDELDTPEDSY